MSLETQIANLVAATNQLTGEVSGKMAAINQTVDAKKAELDAWRNGAKAGYPAFNLLNNALLNKKNVDGSPKGFAVWNSQCNVALDVVEEIPGPGGWIGGGNLLRIDCSPNGDEPYFSLWPSVQGLHGANNPNIMTTRGFEYRVVSFQGGADAYIGWESGNELIDITKNTWTQKVLTLPANYQTNVLMSVRFQGHPANSRLVIELRNIFVNLGEANSFSLGLSEITDLTI